jgi:hypothetical protein
MKRHRPKVIYSAAFVIAKAGNNPNVYFLGWTNYSTYTQ